MTQAKNSRSAATNPFKTALAEGRTQVGLWLSMANAYSAEMCATAGFDWLLIDGEHAPSDLRTTLAQLQAVAAYPGHPVVRVVQGDNAGIKQLLDIGAQSLLVPMIDTAEQAKAMVAGTLTGDVIQARHYLGLGAQFVAVGIDVTLMMQAVRDRAREFDLGEEASPAQGPSPY